MTDYACKQAQEISLNYHFRCEQYSYFASGAFFNFNGTAGVWRKACIDAVGGWNARTTVEDMDLSLRAYLGGWQAVYLKDLPCLNEVSSPTCSHNNSEHAKNCCVHRLGQA
jgi:beta-mannan synthase